MKLPTPPRRSFLKITSSTLAGLAITLSTTFAHSKPEAPTMTLDTVIQDVRKFIPTREASWKEQYFSLLRIPTISGEGENSQEKQKAATLLEHLLQEQGLNTKQFTIEYQEGDQFNSYPIIYAEKIIDSSLPTILIGTHYDVRPKNESDDDKWKQVNIFEPHEVVVEEDFGGKKIKDTRVYARGADDSKGHIMAILGALEFYQSYQKMLVNIKILFEGREEKSSAGMRKFIEAHQDLLKADAVIIADAPTLRAGIPSIYYGLRGYLGGEIEIVTSVEKKSHSGSRSFVPNSLGIASVLMHKLQDPLTGKVLFPEFYEGIIPPTAQLLKEIDEQYQDTSLATEEKAKKELGLIATVGDKTYSPAQRTTLFPSFDYQLVTGGGEGVLPNATSIKYAARLVRGQDSKRINDGLQRVIHQSGLEKIAKITLKAGEGDVAFYTDPTTIYQQVAGEALKKVWGTKELDRFIDGAGEPIASMYQEYITPNIIFVAYGHPNDNCHGTNESMLWKNGVLLGVESTVALLYEFGRVKK